MKTAPEGTPDRVPIESRLQRLAEEEAIDLRFLALVAGDVEPSAEQRAHIERVARRRGPRFHSDLLFVVSHRYFAYEEAEQIWDGLIAHRRRLARALGRNPGVAVAALDFLTNVRRVIRRARIIPEPELAAIADLALRDDLTGLFGRAIFDNRLVDEVRRHHRYHSPVALLMADIDDFKSLNDRRGHPMGDEALRQIGRLIQEKMRDVDFPCRYGGEEFALLLPQTPVEPALQLAERLKEAVAREPVGGERITVSVGVAACPTHARDAAGLLRAADEALYVAKGAGKNRVSVAANGPEAPDRPRPDRAR